MQLRGKAPWRGLPGRSALIEAAHRALLRQHKIFRLLVAEAHIAQDSIRIQTGPLSNEEVLRLFVYAQDVIRAPTDDEIQAIRDICVRFVEIRGLPKAPP